jgi:Fe-S cluster assembly ATPase SufC
MGQKYFSKVLAGHPAYSISNGDIFSKAQVF